MYYKKFICIDKEDRYIFGNYNSMKARLLDVQLQKCQGEKYCKSEEEINTFLRNKFIIMLNNLKRFDQN